MNTETYTSKTGTWKITTHTTGQCFATHAVARCGRRRIVGPDRPFGFEAAARAAVEAMIDKADATAQS